MAAWPAAFGHLPAHTQPRVAPVGHRVTFTVQGRSSMSCRCAQPPATPSPATGGGLFRVREPNRPPAVFPKNTVPNWCSGDALADRQGPGVLRSSWFRSHQHPLGVARSPDPESIPPPLAVVSPAAPWAGPVRPHGCTGRPPRHFRIQWSTLYFLRLYSLGRKPSPRHFRKLFSTLYFLGRKPSGHPKRDPSPVSIPAFPRPPW